MTGKYREHSSKSHFGSHHGERTEWLYFPQFENYRRFPGFLADPEATICLPHSRPPQKILLQATNSLSAKKALLPSHDLWYFISLLPYLLLSMSNWHPPPPLMMIMLGFKRVSGQDTAQICPPICNNRKSITDDTWDNSFWRHDIRKERTIINQVGLRVAYRFTALRRISGCSTERKNPGGAWPVLWDKEKELRGRAQRKPTGIYRVHTQEFSRAQISSCK